MKGIFRPTFSIFLTSKDLYEIANKMEKIEREALPGDSAIAKEWYCEQGSVIFILDQEKASRLGLLDKR